MRDTYRKNIDFESLHDATKKNFVQKKLQKFILKSTCKKTIVSPLYINI